MWKERAKKLLEDHWKYHNVMLATPLFSMFNKEDVQKLGEWYKDIGFHFYKHAVEDVSENVIKVPRVKIQDNKIEESDLEVLAGDCMFDIADILDIAVEELKMQKCVDILKSAFKEIINDISY